MGHQNVVLTNTPSRAQARGTERWPLMPCSRTRRKAHAQNDGVEGLYTQSPCPTIHARACTVYSYSILSRSPRATQRTNCGCCAIGVCHTCMCVYYYMSRQFVCVRRACTHNLIIRESSNLETCEYPMLISRLRVSRVDIPPWSLLHYCWQVYHSLLQIVTP